MRLNSDSRMYRPLLYFIGACTLVSALMVFSGVCWGVLTLWGDKESGLTIGYWELFWIATTMVIGSLAVRLVRRRPDSASPGFSSSDWSPPDWPSPDPASPHWPSPDPAAVAAVDLPPRGEKNWRELYKELSPEERREMKRLLDRYCSEECTPTTCSDSCLNNEGAAGSDTGETGGRRPE